MRIDVTKSEFEIIIDALKGQLLKCTAKQREQLAKRLDYQLHPSKAPNSNGWAPMKEKRSAIKSAWPTGGGGRNTKRNWAFSKPRKQPSTKTTPAKVESADDILNSL